MADSYVTSGATIKCSCGDKTAKLTVYPDRTVFLTEKPMANISDHVSMYNIAPFGKCHTTSFPPTGSATAANHGTLTPMPCMPGTISDWLQGKDDYIIKGKPALLKSSYCKCQWGGIITITNDGQTDTGDVDLNRFALKSEEEILKKQEEEELAENAKLDVNSVLDGIQTALDLAGFAPGVGAAPDLLNAAISACRGNWAEAGLSVLAAVPLIGDTAAGVNANREKAENAADVAKTVNKTENATDSEKMAKVSEKFNPEKLRKIMDINPDDPRNGSAGLYDMVEDPQKSARLGEYTMSDYLSKNDIECVKDVETNKWISKDTETSNPFKNYCPDNTCKSPKTENTPDDNIISKSTGKSPGDYSSTKTEFKDMDAANKYKKAIEEPPQKGKKLDVDG